jgi:hypothetical protein
MDDKADSSGEMAMLSDLMLRLLSYDLGGGRTSQARELLVGKLPDSMPVEVPVLEDSRIIGSLAHDVMGYRSYSILLGSDIPAERLYDIYDERLRNAGWEKPDFPDIMGGRGGFTRDFDFDKMLAYYKGDAGPTLQVLTHELEDGSSEVRLNLLTAPQPRQSGAKVAQMEQLAQMHAFDARQMLPTLKPPRGGQQIPRGGSGSGDHWSSNAALLADQPAPEVAAHYSSQFEAEGWAHTGDGQSGQLMWSTWQRDDAQDHTWIGQLFIVERTTAKISPRHRYFLAAHSQQMTGDDDDSDWGLGHGRMSWGGSG